MKRAIEVVNVDIPEEQPESGAPSGNRAAAVVSGKPAVARIDRPQDSRRNPSLAKSEDAELAPDPPAPTPEVDATAADDPLPLFPVSEKREKGSIPLIVIAVLAVYFTLYVGRAIFLPITLAMLLALILRPIVRMLRRYRLPDAVSAGGLLAVGVIVAIAGLIRLVEPAEGWIRAIPENLEVIKSKLEPLLDEYSGLAATTEKVNELTAASEATAAEPVAVEIRQSGLSTNIAVASVTGNLLGMTVMIIALAFFLLASGDRLLNNSLSLFPSFSEKKKLVELVYDVERGVAGYLFMVTCINASVGIATALIFWLIGVPNAVLWGLVAFAFNYIPIFGPVAAFFVFVFVSLVSFDSLAYACLAPACFAAVASIEGNLVTPALMGRSMSLNPIVVFLALIVWGWLWGLGGAFLAVPLIAMLKIGCEKFERTKPLATLLAD